MSRKTNLTFMVSKPSGRWQLHNPLDFRGIFLGPGEVPPTSAICLEHGNNLEGRPPIFQDVILRPGKKNSAAGPRKVGGILAG